VKRRLITVFKLSIAAALVWWLVWVNVTEVRIRVGDLAGVGDDALRVVAVLVEPGDTVEQGQPVLRVAVGDASADLRVERAGRVGDVLVTAGERVDLDHEAFVLAAAIPFRELKRLASSWPWFAAAQLPFGIVLLLAAWRWRILLAAQGIHYRFRDVHSLILIGHFFNQVMLGSTGGDVVKAYYVAVESPDRRTASVTTVFLDRAIGLLVLVAIACVAVLANLDLVLDARNLGLLGLAIGLWAVLGAAIIGAFVFFSDRVRGSRAVRAVARRLPLQGLLERVSAAVYVYKSAPRAVLRVGLISVVIHLLVVVTNLLFLRCLQPLLPPGVPFLLLVPLAQIIMAVPLTPASLGTAETAYDKLFALAGVPTGALVSILQRLTYYFWAAFGCAAYLRRRRAVRRALDASRSVSGATRADPDGPPTAAPEPGVKRNAEIPEKLERTARSTYC